MGHSLRFSLSQWHPAGRVLNEWFPLLYAVTCTVLANWVIPHSSATNPLFLIAIALPLIFPRLVLLQRTDISATRRHIGAMTGGAMVLISVVWLIVLALRSS